MLLSNSVKNVHRNKPNSNHGPFWSDWQTSDDTCRTRDELDDIGHQTKLSVDDVSVEETHHFWNSGTASRHAYQLQRRSLHYSSRQHCCNISIEANVMFVMIFTNVCYCLHTGWRKNGAILSHCKYSESSVTELRGN